VLPCLYRGVRYSTGTLSKDSVVGESIAVAAMQLLGVGKLLNHARAGC